MVHVQEFPFYSVLRNGLTSLASRSVRIIIAEIGTAPAPTRIGWLVAVQPKRRIQSDPGSEVPSPDLSIPSLSSLLAHPTWNSSPSFQRRNNRASSCTTITKRFHTLSSHRISNPRRIDTNKSYRLGPSRTAHTHCNGPSASPLCFDLSLSPLDQLATERSHLFLPLRGKSVLCDTPLFRNSSRQRGETRKTANID